MAPFPCGQERAPRGERTPRCSGSMCRTLVLPRSARNIHRAGVEATIGRWRLTSSAPVNTRKPRKHGDFLNERAGLRAAVSSCDR